MKPPISTKKRHEKAWNWIKEKMFYDLTLNIFSTIWLLIDIWSDIEAGREHWRNEHYHWAISTWAFMFVPFLICFALEIILNQCSRRIKALDFDLQILTRRILAKQRIYFLFDLICVASSYLVHRKFLFFIILQNIQHLYYFFTWEKR